MQNLIVIQFILFITFINLIAVDAGIKVLVTGAAGRTGALAIKKLLSLPYIDPVGLVKSKKSVKSLLKAGLNKNQVVLADVTKDDTTLDAAFKGVDSVILATSAVPKIKLWSLIKILILKLFRKQARPEFYFPKGGDPYNVDWIGAKNQIDAAKRNGVKRFIFVSSMGGTQPDNFLNTIGRKADDDKSGNILLWKRKAEQYLIESGIPYTIIHPGGLIDKPGGQREIILGVDDELLNEKERVIPREDVAEVAVQAIFYLAAKNRAIDIISRSPEQGQVTKDWGLFFGQPGNCKY